MLLPVFCTWVAADDSVASQPSLEYEHIDVSSITYEDIFVGKMYTAHIKERDGAYYFRFIPEEDAVYAFYSLGDKYDSEASLYDANGDIIADKNGGGDNDNFRIEWDLYKGNVYYFGCRMYNEAEIGSYDVVLDFFKSVDGSDTTFPDAPDTDGGDDTATAPSYPEDDQWIDVNSVNINDQYMPSKAKGTIVRPEDAEGAYYMFIPDESGIYSVELLKVQMPLRALVYNSDGYLIHDEIFYEDSIFNIEMYVGESFYFTFRTVDSADETRISVRVSFQGGFSGGGPGVDEPSIDISEIDVNNIYIREQLFGTNVIFNAEMDEKEISYYRFTPEKSGAYSIAFGRPSTAVNCSVYDRFGSPLWAWTIDSRVSFDVVLDAGLEYYFGFRTNSGENGIINTRITYADTVAYTDIYVDNNCFTEITAGEKGKFRFTPNEDGYYCFTSNTRNDTVVYLYDENGNLLATDDDGGEGFDFSLTYYMTVGQTYYYEVGFYDSTMSNAVDLRLYRVVYLDSFELDYNNTDMVRGYEGEVGFIRFHSYPMDATEIPAWTSSDTRIVEVFMDGRVSLKKAGRATITATALNGFSVDIEVVVYESEVLQYGENVLNIGIDERNGYVFIPEDTASYIITIEGIENVGVRVCTAYGAIITDYNIIGEGDRGICVDLTAGMKYGIVVENYYYSEEETFTLTIKKALPVTGIEIVRDSVEFAEGELIDLDVIFYPAGAKLENVQLTTSNSSVVKIEGGRIFAMNPGTAIIKAKSESGFTDTIEINVLPTQEIYVGEMVHTTLDNTYLTFKFFTYSDGEYFYKLISDVMLEGAVLNEYGDELMRFQGHDINFSTFLEIGRKYYIRVRAMVFDGEYDINILISNNRGAQWLNIANGDNIIGNVGSSIKIDVVYDSPDVWEEYKIYSSDESIAYATVDGYVVLCGIGRVEITVISTSGLSDSIFIDVKEIEKIVENTDTFVNIANPGERPIFVFVPDESGVYKFFDVNSGSDTYGTIYNVNMNEIAANDDANGKMAFCVSAYLEAGQVYYLEARYLSANNTGIFNVRVEKAASINKLYISKLPDKMEYVDGVSTRIDYTGLVLGVEFDNGDIVYWEYGNREHIDSYRIVFNESEFSSCGIVYVEVGDYAVDIKYTLVENPVANIEIYSGTTQKYIYEDGGYFDKDENGNLIYFYHLKSHSDAVIKVNYKDGGYELVRVNEYLNGYCANIFEEQRISPWKLGSDNYVIVSYLGHTALLPVTVEESPVDKIEILSGNITLIKEYDGHWNYMFDYISGTEREYFYYNYHIEDVVVMVYYTDGTSQTLTLRELGATPSGYSISDEQHNNPWTVGGNNYLTITYLARSAKIYFDVIENNVDSIEITKAPTQSSVMFGDLNCGFIKEDGTYTITGIDLTGMEFTIRYTDGTEQAFVYDGKPINGFNVEMSYLTVESSGVYAMEIKYINSSAYFDFEVENSNIESIVLTENGVSSYPYGWIPDFIGDTLTINYADSSSYTVVLTEDNLIFEVNYGYSIMINGQKAMFMLYDMFDDEQSTVYLFRVSYLGASIMVTKRVAFAEGVTDVTVKEVWEETYPIEIVVTEFGKTVIYTLDPVFSERYFEDANTESYMVAARVNGVGIIVFEIEKTIMSDGIYLVFHDLMGCEGEYFISFGSNDEEEGKDEFDVYDIDNDGAVTNSDITYLVRSLSGWADASDRMVDVNGDGKVNNRDLITLVIYVANQETDIPAIEVPTRPDEGKDDFVE